MSYYGGGAQEMVGRFLQPGRSATRTEAVVADLQELLPTLHLFDAVVAAVRAGHAPGWEPDADALNLRWDDLSARFVLSKQTRAPRALRDAPDVAADAAELRRRIWAADHQPLRLFLIETALRHAVEQGALKDIPLLFGPVTQQVVDRACSAGEQADRSALTGHVAQVLEGCRDADPAWGYEAGPLWLDVFADQCRAWLLERDLEPYAQHRRRRGSDPHRWAVEDVGRSGVLLLRDDTGRTKVEGRLRRRFATDRPVAEATVSWEWPEAPVRRSDDDDRWVQIASGLLEETRGRLAAYDGGGVVEIARLAARQAEERTLQAHRQAVEQQSTG